jgi:hypothetical protein
VARSGAEAITGFQAAQENCEAESAGLAFVLDAERVDLRLLRLGGPELRARGRHPRL